MESAIRVDANIKLQIAVFATTTVSLNVSYRERINGVTKQPREANIASARITTNGAANYFYYQFFGDSDDVSELLNVAIGLETSEIQRGQCFVRVSLTIGGEDGGAKTPFQILFSDYVTSNSFLAYPGTTIKSSLDGRGYITFTNPANPAVGQNLNYAPNNVLCKIRAVSFNFTTSAAVANRKVNVFCDDGLANSQGSYATTAQAASLTKLYNFSNGVFSEQVGSTFLSENLVENIYVNSVMPLIISADNIDVADQITNIIICEEKWIKA